jgi:hypothetical protein
MIFKGVDGGSLITALTLDMSTGGQLLANPLGVTVPSYAFIGDSNTGMTRPTSDAIQLVTGGSEAIRIDSSQRVGIGTSSPTNALSVEKSITGDFVAEFKQGHSNAGNSYGVKIEGGTNASDTAFLVASQSGSNYFEIQGDGNVGIGESSPSATLHVVGDLKIDDITIDGSTISDGGTLTIDVASNLEFDAGGGLFSFKDDGSEVYRITNSSGDISLKSLTSDKDISIQGNDGGSVVSAVTFDMSDAGTATFNHDVILGDNGKAIFGAGSDLQIYHDGSNSFISDEGTGVLALTTNGTAIQLNADGEQMAAFNKDGSAELYHNNSKKIETTSSGIDVTGLVEFDSLSGTGSVAITDIADEDDMSSDSATLLATQQSIKAYADTKASAGFAVAMAIAL